MNEHLELALKKMNEALEHLNDCSIEIEMEELHALPFSLQQSIFDLEDVIEPLSDHWQETH